MHSRTTELEWREHILNRDLLVLFAATIESSSGQSIISNLLCKPSLLLIESLQSSDTHDELEQIDVHPHRLPLPSRRTTINVSTMARWCIDYDHDDDASQHDRKQSSYDSSQAYEHHFSEIENGSLLPFGHCLLNFNLHLQVLETLSRRSSTTSPFPFHQQDFHNTCN